MALKLGTNSLYKYIPLTNFPVTDIWMDHYYNVITISTCPFSEYDVLHNKLEAEFKVSTRFRDPRPKAVVFRVKQGSVETIGTRALSNLEQIL